MVVVGVVVVELNSKGTQTDTMRGSGYYTHPHIKLYYFNGGLLQCICSKGAITWMK